MDQNGTYIKHFDDMESLKREVRGYGFCKRYLRPFMPDLIEVKEDSLDVAYTDISAGRQNSLGFLLDSRQDADIKDLLSELSGLANRYLKLRSSQGGTRLFFIDRRHRLHVPLVLKDYGLWSRQNIASFNGIGFKPNAGLFADLSAFSRDLAYGYCYPSNGDFHERNIVAPGHLIDFEGGGWNLLSTDIATFLWHTFFAGSHFGPKYAKWSTDRTRASAMGKTSQIVMEGDHRAHIRLNDTRQNLYRQFVRHFLSNIDGNKLDFDSVNTSISYRLATTFDLAAMDKKDRHLSYLLANFFYANRFENVADNFDRLIAK